MFSIVHKLAWNAVISAKSSITSMHQPAPKTLSYKNSQHTK